KNGRDWGLPYTQWAELDGARLRYGMCGTGEPVVVVHGVNIANAVIPPFMLYPKIFEHYQFIGYYRAGYHGSTCDNAQVSIEDGAKQLVQLVSHLGLDKVHLLSFSFGGLIAMQAMLSYPDLFHTSVMIEPYLPRESQAAIDANTRAYTEAFALYEQGDKLAASQHYQRAICGDSFLSSVDLTCSRDVWDEVEEAADTVFTVDMPAYVNWAFRPSKADEFVVNQKPDMPVLAMMGTDSESILPGFRDTQAFLLDWLPQAERCGIPYATHGMQLMNPVAVASASMQFLQKHPLN
ncbi:MAG: alpha/beta hydrolase, partial [Deinococcota bacterium]